METNYMDKAWGKIIKTDVLDHMYLYRGFLESLYIPELDEQNREKEAGEMEEVLEAMNCGIDYMEKIEQELKETKEKLLIAEKRYQNFVEMF